MKKCMIRQSLPRSPAMHLAYRLCTSNPVHKFIHQQPKLWWREHLYLSWPHKT